MTLPSINHLIFKNINEENSYIENFQNISDDV